MVFGLPALIAAQAGPNNGSNSIDRQNEHQKHKGAAKFHVLAHSRNVLTNQVQVVGKRHEFIIDAVRDEPVDAAIGTLQERFRIRLYAGDVHAPAQEALAHVRHQQ